MGIDKEKKKDLRVQKTYLALTNALINLLQTKKFEDISVQEICDRAMIGRATFYKHFADKYEFTTICIRLLQQSYYNEAEEFSSENPGDYYTRLIQHALDFIESNSALIHALETSPIFPVLLDTSSEELTHNLEEHLEKDQSADHRLPANPQILAQLFMGSVMQCSRWWYSHRDEMGKEEMLQTLSSLLGRIFL